MRKNFYDEGEEKHRESRIPRWRFVWFVEFAILFLLWMEMGEEDLQMQQKKKMGKRAEGFGCVLYIAGVGFGIGIFPPRLDFARYFEEVKVGTRTSG